MTWRLVYIPEPAVRLPEFRFAEQREQCLRCCNVRVKVDPHPQYGGHQILNCAVGGTLHSCSLARTEGGRCGPEAKFLNRSPYRIDGRSKRRVLTPEIVRHMRANPEGLSINERARQAGVAFPSARNAIEGKTFKDVV